MSVWRWEVRMLNWPGQPIANWVLYYGESAIMRSKWCEYRSTLAQASSFWVRVNECMTWGGQAKGEWRHQSPISTNLKQRNVKIRPRRRWWWRCLNALYALHTVWSEGFLYKVAPPELKISTIMYFVIHNSVVLSKILKIVVPLV